MTARPKPATARRAAAPVPPPAPPAPEPPTWQVPVCGNLDAVQPDGTIIAWCWWQLEPATRREVGVWIDGVEVAQARCDQQRPDLLGASVGDGAHGLVLKLPPSIAEPGHSVTVTLRDRATLRQIGRATPVTWHAASPEPAPGPPQPSRVMTGNLDRVTKDGWVSGWCWHPGYPDEHIGLTILVDEEPVGTTTAANFRADLKQAGIGDGTYGFSFALPWSVLADKGQLRISVRETASWTLLGEPILMRAGRLAVAEERIRDLERQIRLLRSQLDELGRQDDARDGDRAARELFATVAGFFQAMAEGDAGGVMVGGLRATVEEVTTRFPTLALAIADAPLATVCIQAGASLEVVYRCLQALHETGADQLADIVLLDDGGQGGALALLPAVVRNLRYVRIPLQGSALVARNEVAASGRGALVAFLAPQAAVTSGWLEEIAATFDREPGAAAVGSKVVREDGLLHHTGILAGPDGSLRDPGRLAAIDDPEHDFMRAVHGLGDVAFALRRDCLAELDGFATFFASPAHAVFDLCMRLQESGRQVLYQPLAVAVWSDADAAEPAPVPDPSLPDEDSRRLRQRWLNAAASLPRDRAGFIGRALVIDTAVPQPDHDAGSVATLEQMLLLRHLGYRVTFAAAGGDAAAADDLAVLRRSGIEVAGPPRYPSATQYLEQHGAGLDLVHLHRHTNAALFLDRVRELAPLAKVVFSPHDLHYLREQREAEVSGRAPSPGLTREQELHCVRRSDATIVFSDVEAGLLQQEVPTARLRLLRWIAHPYPSSRGFAGRDGICFVGGFRHSPNTDGLQWFVAEVLPLVLRELPDLRLHVAGSDPPESVRALASANVLILGWVPDLEELFGRMRLSVAPLRFGAGFKGKVATSLAHGLPVVGTAVALEGTGLAPGEGVAVADDPASFARAVVRLHGDEAAWTTLAASGLQRCRELYSPAAALGIYRQLLADLGLPVAAE